MSSTTFIFMTFSAEIILSIKIWFEVVNFRNSKFEFSKLSHDKDDQTKMIEHDFRKF